MAAMVADLPLEFVATSRRDGPRTVVRFDGELDCANEGLARAEVGVALEDGNAELILDLRGLTFLDACGVHVLLDVRSACRAQQRRLLLVSCPRCVERTLAICGLDGYFTLLEPGDDAARLLVA